MHFVSSEPLRKNITENCDAIESVQQDFFAFAVEAFARSFRGVDEICVNAEDSPAAL